MGRTVSQVDDLERYVLVLILASLWTSLPNNSTADKNVDIWNFPPFTKVISI